MNKMLILGFVFLIVTISGCVDHSPSKTEDVTYYTFSESNNGEQSFIEFPENTTQVILNIRI